MKARRSATGLLLVCLLLAAVTGAVAWRLLTGGQDSELRGADPDASSSPASTSTPAFVAAQPVRGAEVIRDTLWIPVTATGEARANRMSAVATRAAGVVEEVHVQENDFVRSGDLLVQLDTTEAAMELERAESQYLTARVDFETRMVAGADGLGLLSDSVRAERERRVRALSGLSAAEVNLRQARRQMEFTRVHAPFAGRVANLRAVEGAFLNGGDEVLTLLEVDPIRVEAEVLESEIGYLEAGRRATVRFSAFGDEAFEATVQSVNPIVDSEARTARVTLVMPNPDHRLRHGMYARVVVDAQAYANRILVPREAVVERNRREVVFVARGLNEHGEAIAEWRDVTTGARNATHIEIVIHERTDLVEPGEVVLVDGHHYLAHDTEVLLLDRADGARGEGSR